MAFSFNERQDLVNSTKAEQKPLITGYSPALSSNEASSLRRVGIWIGKEINVIKQKWADFRAPKEEDKQGSLDVAPRAMVKTNKIFQGFLTEKESSGFTVKDSLKYRYVDYVEATGIAKVVAFFKLGGLGSLFVGKLTADELSDLRKQRDFYRDLCKTQGLFQTFAKSPNPEKFKAASQAFEELHQKHIVSTNSTDTINTLLEKATGKQVSNVLIECAAEQSFQKGGVLTQDNILETLMATAFKSDIKDLYNKGYRPTMTEDEVLSMVSCFPNGVTDETLNSIITEADSAPFFMTYARVYDSIVRPQGKSVKAHEIIHGKTIRSLGAPIEEQVKAQIEQNNKKLLDLVTNPSKMIDEGRLPLGVSKTDVEEMIQLYQDYQEIQVGLESAGESQAQAQRNLEIINDNLTNFGAQTGEYSLDELSPFLEGADLQLPVAQTYADQRVIIQTATQAVTDANQAIQTEITRINTLLNVSGGLVEQAEGLEKRVNKGCQLVKDASLAVNDARVHIADIRIDPFMPHGIATAAERKKIEELTQTHDDELTFYKADEKEFDILQKRIATEKANLEALQASQAPKYVANPKAKVVHALVTARDQAVQNETEAKALKITLTNEELDQININGPVAELKELVDFDEKDLATSTQKIQEGTEALRTQEGKLKEIGLTIVDGVATMNSPIFEEQDYANRLTRHMEKESETTQNLIAVMRQVRNTVEQDNDQKAQERTLKLQPTQMVVLDLSKLDNLL